MKDGLDKIKQENQNKELKQKDLVKLAGQKWRKMTEQEKLLREAIRKEIRKSGGKNVKSFEKNV